MHLKNAESNRYNRIEFNCESNRSKFAKIVLESNRKPMNRNRIESLPCQRFTALLPGHGHTKQVI